MLTRDLMHAYQVRAVEHVIEHPHSMLWLGLGLGKSVITLTAFADLQDNLQVGAMAVFAPKRVAQTVWRQEALKWEHLRHLRFSLVHGSPDQRKRALRVPADVYIIPYSVAHWVVREIEEYWLRRGRYQPWGMQVYDEVTKVKHTSTRVSAHIRRLLPYVPRRVGLTGTPASNGYADLFGQYLALDQGVRLGQSIGAYREAFLRFEGWEEKGRYVVREKCKEEIHERIADITLEMSSRDYLELPEVVINDIPIILSKNLRTQYEQLEDEMFVELDSGVPLEVFAVMALSMKCRQFCNGAAYPIAGDERWEFIHDHKMEALEDVVEEAGGKPVLVSYQFKHDAQRIAKRWPEARFMSSKLKSKETEQLVSDWNDNKIPILAGHPLSMGHGLNLQFSECQDLVMVGVDWAPDLMDQIIGRLMRQGQRNNIRVHRLLVEDSVDTFMRLVLEGKQLTEDRLKAAVRQYRKMKGRG